MHQSNEHKARPKNGKALAIAAALLCATALSQPNLAYAGPHGGGGGGFHGGFGGFHGNGFHGDRFHEGRFRGGFTGFGFYPYYGYYDYGQAYSQTWYYCSDPAGYYPYVAQCNTGWQAGPASLRRRG